MNAEKWIEEHRHDDVNELALKAAHFPDMDVREALVQIRGWQIAEKKLPLWAHTEGILFPDHLPMEQCSSQLTAEYKASLVASMPVKDSMTDLTGGFGVDAAVLGRHFRHLTYVEQREDLCRLAHHNFPLLGINDFEVVNADCVDVLPDLPHQNLLLIDPARRDACGRKTVAISDCTPDVSEMNQLLLEKADTVMIKLSPMLDITSTERQLADISEIHVVSVGGECKEILILLQKTVNLHGNSPIITCADITREGIQQFRFTRADEQQAMCWYSSNIGAYLYEPNASLMKACPFRFLAQHYQLEQLHPNSHLYTSNAWIADFPGRRFKVEEVLPINKQTTKQISHLRQANVSVRNFPATVAELRKRFRLAEGGDTYLFATTLADNRRILIVCKKVGPSKSPEGDLNIERSKAFSITYNQ
jgi:hypothetical protein